MKKIYFLIGALFFAGCAKNVNIDKELKETQIENKIIKKYQISKQSLVKCGDNYYFYEPVNNGIQIFKLDKNYQIKKIKQIKKLIDVTNIKSNNNYLYLLGYDQEKNSPALLIVDKDLNLIKTKYFGKKYDIPKDMIIEKEPVIVLTNYNDGANLEICNGNKCKIFKEKHNTLPKFIKKFNGGYLIVGSIQHPEEDLLILFIKNNKIVWSKVYDFGLDDTPNEVIIKENKAEIKLISQDYMGAEKYITIQIDEQGNILNKKKELEFKQLPTGFRT